MRILGITIPEEKRIEIGLTVVFGVGRSRAHTILDKAKVAYGLKPKDKVEYPYRSGKVWNVKWGGTVIAGMMAQSVCLTDQEVTNVQ